METPALYVSDPWQPLRNITEARIALGRSGGSLPTRELLDFRLAHARARDAVLSPFDAGGLGARLEAQHLPVLCLESAAASRDAFLKRPDLGRRLAPESRELLAGTGDLLGGCDLAIILSDGLSTLAIDTQAEAVLHAFLPLAEQAGWKLAPIVIVPFGRVALQDEIGELLKARLSLMLLGERPGLGNAESLGAYFTYKPHIGATDADRNCVSNIRAHGLPPAQAGEKLFRMIQRALAEERSGVLLKDSDGVPGQPAIG